ncbi:MAG: SCO family protein [Hyphomicrobiales bacterium]|nr:SCO family protein [Hyphomicrobiales bacterium]MCP4998266.1 SCO family protein [Hyphomicrobiales bacterium]
MFPPAAPFTLTDHTGKMVTDEDYRGKFMLINFGYTYCPDVCPTSLQTMSETMALLGEQADWVQPIFVTIDPERDTPEVLKEYVAYFHPKLIGLTGTPQQIAEAAEGFRVYYNRSELNNNGGEDDGDYWMDHTASFYLVGTDGKGLAVFPYNMATMAVEEIVDRIRHFINIQEALTKVK